MTTHAPNVLARSGVVLDDVEKALLELLRCYGAALQFAHDMPLLGISRVTKTRGGANTVTGRSWRFGSGFFTRVYVETHVRKHLRVLKDRLRLRRLELLQAPEQEKLAALVKELEENVEPLLHRRWLVGLLARVPQVVGLVLPLLTGLSLWPRADVSLPRALLTLALVALGLWVVVVWPSVRLGFRVKRAILGGGVDLANPFQDDKTLARWKGFAAPAIHRRNREVRAFPKIRAYEAEDSVYRALATRKPAEVPLDLLFGLAPYLWLVFWASILWALVASAVEEGLWQTIEDSPAAVAALGFGILSTAVLLHYGQRSYRRRPH